MSLRVLLLVLCLVASAGLTGCRQETTLEPSDVAGRSYRAYMQQPGGALYQRFIMDNREAARRHADALDHDGVRYQVWALEVQAREALRRRDEPPEGSRYAVDGPQLGREVELSVDRLERDGLLEVYEDAFPGAAERLRAVREQVRPLFETE